MASGRPVIAYARGGAFVTVVEGETGLLFAPQTVPALAAAMVQCEEMEWREARLRAQAERFSRARFVEQARGLIAKFMSADG
jgi:glycosyltransferase involved in cell wall biosynthesis